MGKAIKSVGRTLGLSMKGKEGDYHQPEMSAAKQYQNFAGDFDNQYGLAQSGVQNDAFTKDVFGQGGMQSQLANEGRDLSSRGFQLSQDDREAYGQVSGDVARMFGQQEQAATQALARRGLGAAGSGAAGAAFSGLQGNKNEMLAQAQMGIAQKRMDNTTQRLQQNRIMQSRLAEQGQGLLQSRYGMKNDALRAAADSEASINSAQRQAKADQQAAYKPGLFQTIGQGLQSGIGQMATQAPGMAVGGMTGGAGGAAMGGAGAAQPRWDTAGGALGAKQNTFTMNSRGSTGGGYGSIA